MMRNGDTRPWLLVGCALWFIVGCQSEPGATDPVSGPLLDSGPSVDSKRPIAEFAGPHLGTQIEIAESDAGHRQVVVHIDYELPEGNVGARMAEFYVEHSPNLVFESGEAGVATESAGKTLVTQARSDTHVRVILFSGSNLNTFPSGRLASLQFEVTDASPVQVSLMTERQMFAPPDANRGLRISDPRVVEQEE